MRFKCELRDWLFLKLLLDNPSLLETAPDLPLMLQLMLLRISLKLACISLQFTDAALPCVFCPPTNVLYHLCSPQK